MAEDPDSEAMGQRKSLIARFACTYIAAYQEDDERPMPDLDKLADKLRTALESDARVTAIGGGPDDRGIAYGTFYPRPEDEGDILLVPSRARAPESYTPFDLTIRVPNKNQPHLLGKEELPETYQARWNGSLLMVFWLEEKPRHGMMFGGQVVRDIVSEASTKAGFPTRIQGPSMAHVDLRVLADPQADGIVVSQAAGDRQVYEITFPIAWDETKLIDHTFDHVRLLASYYYRMKNVSERATVVEDALNNAVEHILLLQHARTVSRLEWRHPIESVRFAWGNRGWRSQAQEAIARVWLSAARLQNLRREWVDVRRFYATLVDERGGFDPFVSDVTTMEQEMAEINVDLPTKIVEHTEGRIGVYYIVVATILAALVGAVAGAVAGHLAK